MPYSSMSDVNPAIKGIKPPVTLEQANWIAKLADEIGGDVGWPTAIKQFKKTHTVRNRRWVRREKKVQKTESAETQTEETMPGVGMATSFEQLRQIRAAAEMAEDVRELTSDFTDMLWNVIYSMETATVSSVQTLVNQYIIELEQMLRSEPAENEDTDKMKFSETYAGPVAYTGLEEADGNSLAYLDVQIIRPGWGNTRDNHFYPAEMLKRDAANFVGAKMYETDHNPAEKSTRTWVSTVKEIVGFTDDGAPIARVAVHDPDFAERVRNLNTAGLLEKMECSIMASGIARKGFESGGRKGSVVEAISEVTSVDWVTRGGAGGKVLSLAESETGADTGQREEETSTAEAAADETVTIHEQETVEDSGQDTPKPLAVEEVQTYLAASKLPQMAQKRLSEKAYSNEGELKEAIVAELEYIKEISGSGRPFGLSESATASKPVSLEEVNRRKDEVNKKYLGGNHD